MAKKNSTDPHAAYNASQVGREVRHMKTGDISTIEAADRGNGTITVNGRTEYAGNYQDWQGQEHWENS